MRYGFLRGCIFERKTISTMFASPGAKIFPCARTFLIDVITTSLDNNLPSPVTLPSVLLAECVRFSILLPRLRHPAFPRISTNRRLGPTDPIPRTAVFGDQLVDLRLLGIARGLWRYDSHPLVAARKGCPIRQRLLQAYESRRVQETAPFVHNPRAHLGSALGNRLRNSRIPTCHMAPQARMINIITLS
jgi:hypothetical protein